MARFSLVFASLIAFVSSAHAETGLASFYGGRGHSGEMTCAHRTRPFGRLVTVTSTGHSIRCRIDVSVSAARALGMMRSGVIRVSVN
jgi:rare lipoprotein A